METAMTKKTAWSWTVFPVGKNLDDALLVTGTLMIGGQVIGLKKYRLAYGDYEKSASTIAKCVKELPADVVTIHDTEFTPLLEKHGVAILPYDGPTVDLGHLSGLDAIAQLGKIMCCWALTR